MGDRKNKIRSGENEKNSSRYEPRATSNKIMERRILKTTSKKTNPIFWRPNLVFSLIMQISANLRKLFLQNEPNFNISLSPFRKVKLGIKKCKTNPIYSVEMRVKNAKRTQYIMSNL